MEKKIKALYVHNMDYCRVLLVLDSETNNDTAVYAIANAMLEQEIYDLDKNEYFEETEQTPEDFIEYAKSIWFNNENVYLDARFEATYGMSTNVQTI